MIAAPAKRSRRERDIWLSVAGTAVGTMALTALGLWVNAVRNTDLADRQQGVTSEFQAAAVAGNPALRFSDVALSMGINMRHGPGARGRTLPEDTGSGLAWGDYDGDGDPDLYVVNFPGPLGAPPDPAESNHLYRNDGDRFTDVTGQAAVADLEGFGMGATFADYDNDGDLDLYVTNYGPNRLYRNRGDGTFEEVAARAGVADPRWSTGATWGDFDRDGWLDLYVCNYVDYDEAAAISQGEASTVMGDYSVPFTLNPNSFNPAPNRLYRNRGDGTFEDVSARCRVSNPDGRSLAATFCDLDGDGWLDLYVNNDASSNKLFRNLGGERARGEAVRFADLSAVTGTADPRSSMGLSVGEIGGMSGEPDGLPDLFLTNWVAQENAIYQSVMTPGGLEYRDRCRPLGLGEISLGPVGWGCAMADFDLDGRPDLVVANGSTLERGEDPSQLITEPMFLLWNDGKRFRNLAPAAGEAMKRPHSARGLAVADFDRDGDVDVAVAINRGNPLLLRNDTPTTNHALAVHLSGPPAARHGARVEVLDSGRKQYQWYGADVGFLGMHSTEMIFGLGAAGAADQVRVRWADGQETTAEHVAAGRATLMHPGTPATHRGSKPAAGSVAGGR